MAVPRIDGLDKVLGRKVYARDLRARDLGWPAQMKYVLLLRAEYADRPYSGIDDERIPAELRPQRRVTAAQLAADKVRSIATFGSFWLVPEGKFPDHIGQPVAICYFDSYLALADFVEWQRGAGAPLRYGAVSQKSIEQDVRRLIDPLLAAVEREPAFDYGSVHYVRLARDGTEEFSHVKDGGHDPTAVGPEVQEPERQRNRAARAAFVEIERAIAEEGWRLFDRTISTQTTDPMFMEPEAGIARRAGETLELVLATQSPHKDIDDVRDMFGAPACPFRTLSVELDARYPGGAFGGRDASSFPMYLALAAAYAEGGAPVRIAFDRFEQFQVGIKRHASAVRTRLAIATDGTPQALVSTTVLDGGGQPNLSRPVIGVSALHGAGPYRIPRTALGCSAVHTNAAPAGSMRGFGIPEVAYGVETLIDEVCASLGVDAIEYRRKHALRGGDRDVSGMVLEHHVANEELCDLALQQDLWKERAAEKKRRDRQGLAYGVGFAMCMEAYGTTRDGVLAEVALERDGTIVVRSSGIDFGQGTATALSIATEPWLGSAAKRVELGQSRIFDALKLVSGDGGEGDPRWTPKVVNSMSASMTAFHHVHAVEEACRVVLDHGVRAAAAAIWGRDASDARWDNGKLVLAGESPLALRDLAKRAHDDTRVVGATVHTYYQNVHATAEFTVDGTSVRRAIDALAVQRGGSNDRALLDRQNPEFPTAAMSRSRRSLYASIGHLVALEVYTRTGRVQLTDAITILDAGEVHHEALLQGQVEGGFAMGVGFALLEELPPAPEGTTSSWNLHRYEVPRASHMPLDRMKLVLVPLDGDVLASGPRPRKKGIAEASMSTVAPAIANAIAHATGARINALPITPARVLEALART